MENSAPSNVWTYNTRWHRYFARLIEANVLKFMSSLDVILFYILFATVWYNDNKLTFDLFIFFYKFDAELNVGFCRSLVCTVLQLSSQIKIKWIA